MAVSPLLSTALTSTPRSKSSRQASTASSSVPADSSPSPKAPTPAAASSGGQLSALAGCGSAPQASTSRVSGPAQAPAAQTKGEGPVVGDLPRPHSPSSQPPVQVAL